MDELLPYPNSAAAPAPARTKASPRGLIRLPSLPHIKLLERRSPMDPAIYLTMALSLMSAGVLGAFYAPAYQVSVDGVDVGLIGRRQAIEEAIDRVEARASQILGYDYTLDQDISYSFQVALESDQISVSQIETYLFDQIGDVMMSSVVRVGDTFIGAADDTAALNAMLVSLKAPYVNENTVSAEFATPLVVTREYVATSALRSVADMEAILSANSIEQVDYTVQSGDTFSGIAQRAGLSVSELQALNPNVDIDKLQIGQVLTVSQAVPFLSVRTVDNVTYEGEVPFETQQVEDNTLYQGDTKILTAGVAGTATYNADITYLNGVEESRDILSTQVHTEPVTQVVAVGTKERPRTVATGSFIWPLSGSITSGYGSRYIFGSYSNHSGIDIAASYGTSIMAADGGKVVFAGTGTGSNWSYGNYVMIDHENGLRTIYAHCSSLCVSTGDRVYQGQVIAKVGSTGRSTGNHCHFQVKKNGVTVSPWNYLP